MRCLLHCCPLVLLLATALTGCAANSESEAVFTPEDSLAVNVSADQWVQGSLKQDWAMFEKSMTPDVILYPGNAAPVRGREAAMAFVKAYPKFETFQVDVAELVGDGRHAYDHGTFTASVRLPNGTVVHDTGSFSALFRKQPDGTWAHHRVIFHSNLPPAAPPAAAPGVTKTRS